MTQGLTLSGLSVDSQSPLLCPMSSTSSTRDRNRIWLSGDVLGGIHILVYPSVPTELMGMDTRRVKCPAISHGRGKVLVVPIPG